MFVSEDVVKSFLADLGYGGHWLPAAAKFWTQNGLGLLTVFPSQFAIKALREVATAEFRWKRGRPGAFLLPRQRRRHVLTGPEAFKEKDHVSYLKGLHDDDTTKI